MASSRATPVITFGHDPFSVRAAARMGAGALVVVLLGWALGALVAGASPLPAEERVLDAVAALRNPWATSLLVAVSVAGSLEVVAVLALLLVPVLRRLTGGWEAAWLLGLALLGSLLTTGAIKVLVGRERPLDALVDATSAAFPSGHASRAAAVLGLAAWAVVGLARSRAVRGALGSALASGVVLLAWSRVYLGVHWPSDVLFGIGLGGWWLFVLLHAVQPRAVPAETVAEDEPRIAGP